MSEFRLPPFVVRHVVTALAEQIDWGLKYIGIETAWQRFGKGAGVTVAVLDTGVDSRHPDLQGAIAHMQPFGFSSAEDENGHGCHCAGIVGARSNDRGIIGAAPECSLWIGRVLDRRGSGSDRQIAAGIRGATESKVDIISGSFGSPDDSPIISDAVKEAVAAGIWCVFAAGNDGRPNSVNWPAALDVAIAVGATDQQGRVTDFSSRGEQVDVAAPGKDVLSTWLSGRYARLDGTSMATPCVAGTLALYRGHLKRSNMPIPSALEVLTILQRTSKDIGEPGRDDASGWGLIAPEAMLAPDVVPPRTKYRLIPVGGTVISIPPNPNDDFSVSRAKNIT